MLDPGLIGTVATLLGVSVRHLALDLDQARRDRLSSSQKEIDQQRASLVAGLAKNGYITKALNQYYTDEHLGHDLVKYAFELDEAKVHSCIATKPSWIGRSIPLDEAHEKCALVSPPPLNMAPQLVGKYPAQLLASIEQRGLQLWNDPIYRLVSLDLDQRSLTARFASDEFIRYRFTIGLLLDELIDALIKADFSTAKLAVYRSQYLPLRQQLLPDGDSLVDFNGRMCAGGPLALFAVARPRPHNDFALLLQRRSKIVSDAQEMISVIPKCFHQPTLDPLQEVSLTKTLYREIYEELFGGREAEKEVHRVRHDWFLEECKALRWLILHQDVVSAEITSFGVNLISGNYEFAMIFAIHDPYFWRQYSSKFVGNWESSKIDILSSLDTEGIRSVLSSKEWTGEGLFAFVEGLKRLQALSPRKVKLPRLHVVL